MIGSDGVKSALKLATENGNKSYSFHETQISAEHTPAWEPRERAKKMAGHRSRRASHRMRNAKGTAFHVKTILFALSPLVLKDWGNKDRQSNDFENNIKKEISNLLKLKVRAVLSNTAQRDSVFGPSTAGTAGTAGRLRSHWSSEALAQAPGEQTSNIRKGSTSKPLWKGLSSKKAVIERLLQPGKNIMSYIHIYI